MKINEAQIYDGGEDLAKHICKIIKDNPKEDFIVINAKDLKFKNKFFKHLLLYINDKPISEKLSGASYNIDDKYKKTKETLGELLRWNFEENIFNYIEIYIETSDKTDRDVDWEDLSHELNHAWDDYQKRLKDPNKNLISDVDIKEYDLCRDLYNRSNNRYDIIIGYIKYVTTEFEKKSFSVQATSKIKANLDKYSNFDDALKWQFENNEVFVRFLLIYDWFKYVKNSSSMTTTLCDKYRKYFENHKDLSNSEIIEELDKMFNDYYNALVEDINSLLAEYAKTTTI